MRKTVAVLLGLVCMVSIAGCGGGSPTSKTDPDLLPTPVPAPIARTVMGGAIQGVGPISFNNYSVTTFVGSSAGFSNHSTAVSPPAKFNRPIAVTTDGTNLYVADFFNNVIRQIEIATGIDRTIAGNASGLAGSADTAAGASGLTAFFNRPSGITIDNNHNLYVADAGNFTIRKIALPTGVAKEVVVTTIAGSAGASGSFDDPVGTNARFNVLNGITTDGASLYVTDSNNTIRRISLSGTFSVTTLAGTPGKVGSIDTADATAGNPVSFNQPARLTTDGPNLYVTGFGDSKIRKIDLKTGVVSTIAGKAEPGGAAGFDADSTLEDPTGKSARFNQPNGITTDGTYLYVTDSYANTVRKIDIATGNTTTIAGTAAGSAAGSAGLIDGNRVEARLNTPMDITTDGVNLYVVDIENHRIRKIH